MEKIEDWIKFVLEEWITNWERPDENITKEEVFLMLYRFSVDFLQEEWKPNEKFEFKKENNSSDWARESYFFIVSEWIDEWKNPKEFISKNDLSKILFTFFDWYSEFKIEKNPKDWSEKNWIIKGDFDENILRKNFWNILLVCTEILEN